MYELTEELAQYSDADPPVALTGTRFFKDLSGDTGIILTPLAQYPGVSLPALLHARLKTDRIQGHLSQRLFEKFRPPRVDATSDAS
jgi:hypothetical protein